MASSLVLRLVCALFLHNTPSVVVCQSQMLLLLLCITGAWLDDGTVVDVPLFYASRCDVTTSPSIDRLRSSSVIQSDVFDALPMSSSSIQTHPTAQLVTGVRTFQGSDADIAAVANAESGVHRYCHPTDADYENDDEWSLTDDANSHVEKWRHAGMTANAWNDHESPKSAARADDPDGGKKSSGASSLVGAGGQCLVKDEKEMTTGNLIDHSTELPDASDEEKLRKAKSIDSTSSNIDKLDFYQGPRGQQQTQQQQPSPQLSLSTGEQFQTEPNENGTNSGCGRNTSSGRKKLTRQVSIRNEPE